MAAKWKIGNGGIVMLASSRVRFLYHRANTELQYLRANSIHGTGLIPWIYRLLHRRRRIRGRLMKGRKNLYYRASQQTIRGGSLDNSQDSQEDITETPGESAGISDLEILHRLAQGADLDLSLRPSELPAVPDGETILYEEMIHDHRRHRLMFRGLKKEDLFPSPEPASSSYRPRLKDHQKLSPSQRRTFYGSRRDQGPKNEKDK